MTGCGDDAEPARDEPDEQAPENQWDEPAVQAEPAEQAAGDQWDEAELAAVLHRACADPPRRFALCEDTDQMRVFAWGLDFGDWTVLAGTERNDLHVASFGSAVGALHRFGVNRDLHLCWVDPEPAERAEATG